MATAVDKALASVKAYKPVSSTTAQTTADTKYGVQASQTRLSALRGLVDNLTSSVEAVDPSVTGRTTGTFTTEGQRQALVSREKAPILTNLGKQQSAAGLEQTNFNTSQGLASQMASAILNDDKVKYQKLLDVYNATSAQAASAETKRQYEKSFAETKRQNDKPTVSASKAVSTPKVAKPTVESLFAGYNPKTDQWYTENVVIPKLMSTYGYTQEKAAKQAYDYRKLKFGE